MINDKRIPEERQILTVGVAATDKLHGDYCVWCCSPQDKAQVYTWVKNRGDMTHVRIISPNNYRPKKRTTFYPVREGHPALGKTGFPTKTIYKAEGICLGIPWGERREVFYPTEEYEDETFEGLCNKIKTAIKDGTIDKGFGFEKITGAQMEIVRIETITINGKDYSRTETIGEVELRDGEAS